MNASIVLFTSDLRLHDHPPLRAALNEADEVVPLFVRDDRVDAAGFAAPNRLAFLADSLTALDEALRERGGHLVVRSGDVVEQVGAVVAETGAGSVHMAAGATGFAQARERRLRAALAERGCALTVHDCVVTAVAPGAVTPAGGDHFAVFTPYFRRWSQQGVRDVVAAPRTVRVPSGLASERVPARADVREVSPGVPPGGEAVARAGLTAWLRSAVASYADGHDDLAGDLTSRLSPHLHFGTLSAVELVHRVGKKDGPGPDAFVRQLCWRDFHHQVLPPLPAPPGRRRHRREPAQLAVDGGHRQRHPPEPRPQPCAPGQAPRPGRDVRTPLGSRACGARRRRGARAVEAHRPGPGPVRLPRAGRRPRGGSCTLPAGTRPRLNRALYLLRGGVRVRPGDRE